MTRWMLAVLALGLGGAEAARDPARAGAYAANARLARTVNFGNMLEAPREGDWGLRVEERFFDLTRSAGFTAVRLPVRWNAHAGREAPYTVDPAFFARVDAVLAQARRRGLAVVLDFHHYEELMEDPAGHRARFLAIWGQVAARYRAQPPEVLFEVLNEPSGKLNTFWPALQNEALAVIRKTNPRRAVVVGGGDWNSAGALSALRLPAGDPNLIGTFHHYAPFAFTHQGAEWVTPRLPVGVAWPAVGLRPAGGWADWSWGVRVSGVPGGLKVSPVQPWGALYLHRDPPLSGATQVRFVTSRDVALSVTCLEAPTSGAAPPPASVQARAGQVTQVPLSACGNPRVLGELWLMPVGGEAQPPFELRRLEVVTAAGTAPLLGSAQVEAAAPIRTAAAWGKAQDRPVFMGEFGAYGAGNLASRARWAAFVRAEAERAGMGWAWWELAAGFGVYDPKENRWRLDLVRALLPGTPLR